MKKMPAQFQSGGAFLEQRKEREHIAARKIAMDIWKRYSGPSCPRNAHGSHRDTISPRGDTQLCPLYRARRGESLPNVPFRQRRRAGAAWKPHKPDGRQSTKQTGLYPAYRKARRETGRRRAASSTGRWVYTWEGSGPSTIRRTLFFIWFKLNEIRYQL